MKNPDLKLCLKITGCGLLLFLCIYYWEKAVRLLTLFINASMPIITGFVIAYILNILMSFFEKHYFKKHSGKKLVQKSRRAVCLATSLLTLAAILSLVIWLVIPELFSCISLLITKLPSLIEQLYSNELARKLLPEDTLSSLASTDWKEYIIRAFNIIVSGAGNIAHTIFSAVASVFTGIFNALLSFIFAVYVLLAKDRLKKQFRRLMDSYLHEKTKNRLLHVLSVFNKSFHRFIVGQCIEAVILGVLCTIGMLIFRFPYATMIGTLVGFTALVPIAGAFIGAGIGAVMIFTVSPVKAVLFVLFIIVLQQLEENLIYPKVVGKSVGLPSIWVLAAITVGGGVMGILGMLIGVPIAAALYRLLRENLIKREAAAAENTLSSEDN